MFIRDRFMIGQLELVRSSATSQGAIYSIGRQEDRRFAVLGWVSVHFPCDQLWRMQAFVALPCEVMPQVQTADFVRTMQEGMGIPEGETYFVKFFSPEGLSQVCRNADDQGRRVLI